jgi:hypothetical protein
MVRAVDLDVTSHAGAADDSRVAIRSDLSGSQVFRRLERNRMVPDAELRVALLTQEGGRRDQQAVSIRTVRQMTTRTALGHRSVLPYEGTSLVGMATRAEIEGRTGAQQWVRRRAVRLMTIITIELAFEEWHMRALSELGSLSRMAAETGLSHRRFAQ